MEMSPIPKTAPFAEEEIDLLNRVVGLRPIQRPGSPVLACLDAPRVAAHWRSSRRAGARRP
jgi:hypothetical protein